MNKDKVSPMRIAAAMAPWSDPSPRSSEALVAAASSESVIVRATVLNDIARRNDAELLAATVPSMGDENDVARYTVAAAFARLSHG
jgi:HEAT repeat protein